MNRGADRPLVQFALAVSHWRHLDAWRRPDFPNGFVWDRPRSALFWANESRPGPKSAN